MEHLDTPKFIGLAVIGIILLVIIGAFVFSEKFRKDVIASQGEASILGMFNVKGVIIILLTAIFCGAFIYILAWNPKNQETSTAQSIGKHHTDNQKVFINDTAYYYSSSKPIICRDDNKLIQVRAEKKINGINNFYYRIDSIRGLQNGKFWTYIFEVSFGEEKNDSIIWTKKPFEIEKTRNGKITDDSKILEIADPKWEKEYRVLMAFGQPDSLYAQVENSSIIIACSEAKINQLTK